MSDAVLITTARNLIRKYVMRHRLDSSVNDAIMAEIELILSVTPINQILFDYGGKNGLHLNYDFFLALEMRVSSYCKYHH